MADNMDKKCDDGMFSMLLELTKSVAVLTAEFKSFKSERNEDNMELKESIKEVKADVKKLTDEVNNLKANPAKEKADKWEHYTKLIFDLVVSAAVVILLVKLGLK